MGVVIHMPQPYEMTPELFGKTYAPIQQLGENQAPRWSYPIGPKTPYFSRSEAVQNAHRYVVKEAILAGIDVPDNVRQLYPDIQPPTPEPVIITEPEPEPPADPLAKAMAEIMSPWIKTMPVHAIIARQQETDNLIKADLAQIDGLKTDIAELIQTQETALQQQESLIKAHQDGQALQAEQYIKLLAETLQRQQHAIDTLAEQLKAAQDHQFLLIDKAQLAFTEALTRQVRLLAEIPPQQIPLPVVENKPKKYTFKINRNADGFIDSIDTENAG